MRPLTAVLMLSLVTLAGCGDDTGDPIAPTSAECLEQGLILDETGQACVEAPFVVRDFEDPNHDCVVNKQRDRVHAPDLVGNPWTIGQSWTYDLSVDGEALPQTQLIYYADQDIDGTGVPLHYMVGTPTREEALHHAIFGENPMIGRVHRVLYSPHESGDHADMFHFPLCQGSSWQTTFYGETFTLTASNATIQTPNGPDQGFAIEGTSEAGGTLRLSYSPAMQWFTYIDLDRANGGTVDMTLASTGTGYSGEAFFLRGQKDEFVFLTGEAPVANVNAAVASQTVSREDGGDGPYDSIAIHVVTGLTGSGAGRFVVTAPDGTEAYNGVLGVPSGISRDEQLLEVPYQAGDWVLSLEGAAVDPASAFLFAHATMVSVYDRSGSV